jgi:hypothetical protein
MQDVCAQVLKLNPNFTRLASTKAAPSTAGRRGLRQVDFGNWPLADKGRIEQGISYLASWVPRRATGPAWATAGVSAARTVLPFGGAMM